MNSVSKKHKSLCKNTKTIIPLRLGDYRGIFTSTSSRRIFNNYSPKPEGEVIIGEYSPRRSRGEYFPIITEPEGNNCFSICTQVFCVFWD
jgi:hypothetical protein